MKRRRSVPRRYPAAPGSFRAVSICFCPGTGESCWFAWLEGYANNHPAVLGICRRACHFRDYASRKKVPLFRGKVGERESSHPHFPPFLFSIIQGILIEEKT